jgi:hypothetical protein
MNAEKYGLDRIYFGGCFIRGMSGAAGNRLGFPLTSSSL